MVIVVGAAQARPGDLDRTFGIAGKVTTTIGPRSGANAVAVQSDGKIVAAGWGGGTTVEDFRFVLVRYDRNGSLDAGFGSGGWVTTGFAFTRSQANALAIQPDGKIVAAGETFTDTGGFSGRFVLARYTSDGSLDATFGDNGRVVTDFGSSIEGASALVLQSDGKIIAAGARGDGTSSDFALARYNPDGSLDPSFGVNGKVMTSVGFRGDASAVALQLNGKIVAAGSSSGGGPTYSFALVRYNTDGSLDSSLGAGGIVTTAFGSNWARATALAIRPDGRVVVAGYSSDGMHSDIALARFMPDGSLDESFGIGGKVTTEFPQRSTTAFSMAIQSDGKIVTAGSVFSDDVAPHFLLVRYKPDGSLDSSFGSGGTVTTAVSSLQDYAQAVALQRDGRIVAAGVAGYGPSRVQFALARFVSKERFCVVPGVRRKPVASARRTILQSGCSLGAITRAYSQRVRKGHVISQRPAPGTRKPERAKVNLVVSKGKRKHR